MPKLYEYLGIIIFFYSDEHEPIHVHAIYNNTEIKILFSVKNGVITNIIYKDVGGNFPKRKKKQLKEFIDIFKDNIVWAWNKYFILKEKVDFEKITRQKFNQYKKFK